MKNPKIKLIMFTILFPTKEKTLTKLLLIRVLTFLVVGHRSELSNFLREDVEKLNHLRNDI